jgi:hypothetical protein
VQDQQDRKGKVRLKQEITLTQELIKQEEDGSVDMKKPGLYANIHKKRKRIAAGSGEKMRQPGSKGAPTSKAFKKSAKTVKKMKAGGLVKSGIARACGKVMDDRRKVTKYY